MTTWYISAVPACFITSLNVQFTYSDLNIQLTFLCLRHFINWNNFHCLVCHFRHITCNSVWNTWHLWKPGGSWSKFQTVFVCVMTDAHMVCHTQYIRKLLHFSFHLEWFPKLNLANKDIKSLHNQFFKIKLFFWWLTLFLLLY